MNPKTTQQPCEVEDDASDSPLSAINPQLAPPRPHVRNGKVARLPAAIRESINVMLHNGDSYPAIVRKLDEMGYPGILVQNLSRWRWGGYEDWLVAQDKFDIEKLRAESFAESVKAFQDSASLEQGNETLMALHIFRSLQELQDCPSEKLLGSRATKLFRLVRVAAAQSAERTKRERLQFNKEVHETDLVDQLLSNPDKLNSILTKIRERLTGSPTPANHTSCLSLPTSATHDAAAHPQSSPTLMPNPNAKTATFRRRLTHPPSGPKL